MFRRWPRTFKRILGKQIISQALFLESSWPEIHAPRPGRNSANQALHAARSLAGVFKPPRIGMLGTAAAPANRHLKVQPPTSFCVARGRQIFRHIGSPNLGRRFRDEESLKCSYLGSTGQQPGKPCRLTARFYQAMSADFWERLRRGFMQLRRDCAINPPVAPAGRLTAIWTAQPPPGQWELSYWDGVDGYGVTRRFEWHAQKAAARLGCSETGQKAVWFWLDRVKRDAPESHLQSHLIEGSDGTEQVFSVEVLDICGLSAFAACQPNIAKNARLMRSRPFRPRSEEHLRRVTERKPSEWTQTPIQVSPRRRSH
jgi:hypothetical protein